LNLFKKAIIKDGRGPELADEKLLLEGLGMLIESGSVL
jgi:hypothetical protein